MISIRDAQQDDIPAITKIYNHAVLHTTAIWNSATADEANRLRWLNDRMASGYPVLVAVSEDGALEGYASFGDWRPFDGYRHTVENSIYVRHDCQGRGLGSALLKELIQRAIILNKHAMVAGIEAKNLPSLRLHEKLGFQRIGLFPEVGIKFGQWLDLVFMQRLLEKPAGQ